MSSTISLTFNEALTVAQEMRATGPFNHPGDVPTTREETDALIRRLQIEAAVRDAAGWWGDGDPYAVQERGEAPATVGLAPSGLPALAELLPEIQETVMSVLADCERHEQWLQISGVREELRMLAAVKAKLDAELVTA